MKFFIVLALVAFASANNLNYKFNGQNFVLNGKNVYSGQGLLSGGSYGASSGYGSGLGSGSSYGSSSKYVSSGGSGGYGSGLGSSSKYVSSGGSGGYGSGARFGSGSSYGSSGSLGLAHGGSYSQGLGGLAQGGVILAQIVPVQSHHVQTAHVAAAAPSYGFANAGYSQGSNYQSQGPIHAAVQSTRNVQVVDGPSGSPAQPQTIIIGPSVQPLDFEFQSQSSPVTVRQSHIPGTPSQPQESSHQEEPDYLKQEIVKPIVHEVTEAIQPYRKVTQEIRPVEETITQLVTRGQQQQQYQQAAYSRPQQQQSYQAVAPVQTVALQAAPVQTVAYQAAPVQTVALQPVQAAQQQTYTIALQAAQPAYSAGYQTVALQPVASSGYSQGLNLHSGSTSYSKPALSSYSASSEYTSPDNY